MINDQAVDVPPPTMHELVSQAYRAFADPDDLITTIRRRPRQLQYRHDVFDGCLTCTGLRTPP
jgi:hypothetical protein